MQTTPTTRTAPHLLKPITAGRRLSNSKTISAERQLRCRGFQDKNPFSIAEDAYYVINNQKTVPPKCPNPNPNPKPKPYHQYTFRFVEKYLRLSDV